MLKRLNARSAVIHERLEISLKQVLPPLAQETEYLPLVREELVRMSIQIVGLHKAISSLSKSP